MLTSCKQNISHKLLEVDPTFKYVGFLSPFHLNENLLIFREIACDKGLEKSPLVRIQVLAFCIQTLWCLSKETCMWNK